jgi:hypothetical protein
VDYHGPRGALAFDVDVEDFVGGGAVQRIAQGNHVYLDGLGFDAVAEDVAGQQAGTPQLGDLLACYLARLN